ncbi:MAG: ribose-phosphate pyrophosphokinase [Gemmatimonadetes bacterium]|nr:ribose-phosphate pyrophosphokinase [Gemmatimonadota bacterium]
MPVEYQEDRETAVSANHELRLLTGGANPGLSEAIARNMGERLTDVELTRFADGEIFVKINENVRGRDVFIIQPTPAPADNLMELLLLIDAARRASSNHIAAVVPYYGYARADRKDQPRVAISAKLVANMLVNAGVDRLITIDLHSHQVQGFFDIPVDHLYASPVFLDYFREKGLEDLVVVAPDVGAAKMARGFARRMNASMALIDKRRPVANESEVVHLVGEVEGRNAILIDDMIDTAGTFAQAARALADDGAKAIFGCATHALLSRDAVATLQEAPFEEVCVTNTLPIPEERKFDSLRVLSVAGLLAKAIRYNHEHQSVSSLFPD